MAIWSLRLGLHIAVRTSGISDDPRYAAFAGEWGIDSPRKMFVFLQNQGFGSIPLVFAIFVAARFPDHAWRVQDLLGALILLIGIAGEALADAQLKGFRKNPANKGRVCDIGLWRWSRHPNYFFEWFGWLAYPVIAISLVYPSFYPWGWATLLAPVFMYWILVHVTGIPPLEAQMLRSRGARYRDYQSHTSRFFPRATEKGSGRMSFASRIIGTAERVPLPDVIVRAAIQRLCSRTAARMAAGSTETDAAFAHDMAARAIAEHTDAANAQHYEVPAAFFALCWARTANTRRASTRNRSRRCARPRKRRCARPSTMRILRTDNRSWNSAAAGVRCRCGWRGNFRTRKLRECRIRGRSATISKPRPPSAA